MLFSTVALLVLGFGLWEGATEQGSHQEMLPACCELYFSVRRILIFICKRSPSRVVVLGLKRLSKSDCGEAVVASSHNGLSSRVRARATISQYWIKATRAALWPGKVRPGKEWREGGRQQLGTKPRTRGLFAANSGQLSRSWYQHSL